MLSSRTVSIVIRRTPRDSTEGVIKDFTQGCNIREEFPMSVIAKKACELSSIGVLIGEE